jgi:hypothetical protein
MSFVNPLFFLGALAAAVPILLHLIKRERAQKILFPSLMYLRKVSRKTIRYQKLRHLLLLLMRVLALLLVVLAFARPFREIRQASADQAQITQAHIILLDNSMSMAYGDRWDRAKKAAAAIVQNARGGDRVAVLEFSDRTLTRTSLTNDFEDALGQLEHGVEISDRPTRYGQALRIAEKVALDAGTKRRTIHLISDFQKNGEAGADQDFRLGSGIELQYVDVGSDDFSNLALGDVQVTEADESGSGLKIKCSVVNFGTRERDNAKVYLSVDGRNIAEKLVRIPKGGNAGVQFDLPGLTSGAHPLVLEVEDPELRRDNRFVMSVEARDKTPVLAIENPDSGRGQRSPSYFLSSALNVSTLSPYRLTALSPQRFEASSSIPGGLVIWNNVSGGSGGLQRKLQDFVNNGGGLAIVLDDSSLSSDFNRTFATWLPVRISEASESLGRRKQPGDYALLTDVRMDHPIFRPFSEPHSGSFSSARFYRFAPLAPGPGAEVIARFDNGDPALVGASVGKGRVLIFASSADDSSNDLPLKAVYAPFWQQILRYLENFQEGRRWVEVGDTVAPRKLLVESALRQGQGGVDLNQAVAVLDPAKERVALPPGSDAIEVQKAGFYDIRTSRLSTFVAVNPVPRESDLTHGNSEEMVAGWTSTDPKTPPAVTADERLTPEEQERRQHFWLFILLAALLFLVAEAFLSNQAVLKSE